MCAASKGRVWTRLPSHNLHCQLSLLLVYFLALLSQECSSGRFDVGAVGQVLGPFGFFNWRQWLCAGGGGGGGGSIPEGDGMVRILENPNLEILAEQNLRHFLKTSAQIMQRWPKLLMRNSGQLLLFRGGLSCCIN